MSFNLYYQFEIYFTLELLYEVFLKSWAVYKSKEIVGDYELLWPLMNL